MTRQALASFAPDWTAFPHMQGRTPLDAAPHSRQNDAFCGTATIPWLTQTSLLLSFLPQLMHTLKIPELPQACAVFVSPDKV